MRSTKYAAFSICAAVSAFGDHEKIVVVAVCPNVEQNRDDLRHSRFKDSCFDIAAAELGDDAAVALHVDLVESQHCAHRVKDCIIRTVCRALIILCFKQVFRCRKTFYRMFQPRLRQGFSLRKCVQEKIMMRTCKNCGKYFALTVHGSTEYCSRVFDSRGRTCKEVGAMRQYVQSHAQDELLKIYRREYKRRFAWIRAGKISQEAFSAWSKEAQREKEKCEAGEISQGEFAQWLKGT